MFYSVSSNGAKDSDIGVATSNSIDIGSWTDHGTLGIGNSSDYNRIDSNLMRVNADGSLKLSFGSF